MRHASKPEMNWKFLSGVRRVCGGFVLGWVARGAMATPQKKVEVSTGSLACGLKRGERWKHSERPGGEERDK